MLSSTESEEASMRGDITVEGVRGGLEVFVDGAAVATLQEPVDRDADTWGVSTSDGASWAVRFEVPKAVSDLLESGDLEALGIPEITAWATDVMAGDDVLRHAEFTVSSKTLAPVVISMSTAHGEVTMASDAEWAGWSIHLDGATAGSITVDKEVEGGLERDLDLPTVLLIVVNAVAMAGSRTRPMILTAKRMERKTRESLFKKHGDAIARVDAAGHDVRYLSAWSNGAVYGWFECLACGRTASTFETTGGEMRGAMGFGTTLGRLKGSLLDGNCPGDRGGR
jgi:hypothetical protein